MFAPYIFARLQNWQNVDRTAGAWRWAAGALAFAAAAALWLVPMLLAVQHAASPDYAAYAHDILFHQTAGRYTDSWDHQHPFWYYAGVIATSWLPLTLALPWLAPRWHQRLRDRDARVLLPLAWIVLVVLFFSFPKGKRDVYVMPALPLLAVCAAPFLREIVERIGFRRLALGLIALIGIGFLGAGIYALAWHPPFAKQLAEERGLADGAEMLWLLLIALGLWTLACALIFGVRRGVHALLAGILGMWLLWSLWAYPLLNDSSSAAGVMQRTAQVIGPDAQLGLVAWKEQNLLMADRGAVDFGFARPWHLQLSDAIRWQEAAPENRWVFVLADAMAPCVDKSKAIHAGHANRREWWLFRADAVVTECRNGHVPASAAQENPNAE
jgi:4-amino-4-deoxy-L-arabinose transferase-like glycosyltransferase